MKASLPLFCPLRWVLPLLSLLLAVGSAGATTPLVPGQLRCEYLENPLGLDVAKPRLSWIVTGDGRARRQTAYQIRVARNEADLASAGTLVWDSGKVASDETSVIAYAGPTLTSATRYWWSVCVWDEEGRASAWSPPVWWEMGLLNPADWHGQWIARATFAGLQVKPPTRPPLLRRDFQLTKPVKQARVYISGLGYYELSLNGRRVGDHELDPGYTRYDRRVLYVTHDVTSALQQGDNTLGVMLGNGWFNVETVAAWKFESAPWRASPRVLLELRVDYADGTSAVIASDPTWRTSDSPITFSSIYGGENYDARLEQRGWDVPGFDTRAWSSAVPVDAPKGKLVAQAMAPIRVTQVIKPVKVTAPAPGVYVFDAGQNLAGNAELILSAPAGTEIRLRYGERVTPEGRVDQTDSGRFVRRADPTQQFQTDSYTFGSDGTARWHSRFNYNGFQYVEVTGAPAPLTADNLSIRSFHSDVPLVGDFSCSNSLLTRIWQNGRWSYLTNLHGIPTDCPHREKNGWTGDAQVACEQGLFYADGITVYQKWINDLADEQFINGALPGIVPTGGQWGYQRFNGPAWDSAFFLIPWHLYEYYGDDSLLRANYDGYRRYVDYLTSRAQNGIVGFGLEDWSPWKTRTPEAVTDTSYYYRCARLVATVARWVGKADEAKKYDGLADSIRAAFNREFYHADSATYSLGSQTALGSALYQGLAEPANDARVLDALVANIAANNQHLDFGMIGSKVVLNALSARGRSDVAYAMASQKTQPSWGWWLEQGATTLWERWTDAGSHNHTFLGDVNAWMVKYLAGIQPDPVGPGFRRIIVAPSPAGDLTSAQARYDSVRGRITSAWTVQGDVFELKVSIPANTVATVTLPAAAAAPITEGGRALDAVAGVKLLSRASGAAVLEVGSGDYVFSVQGFVRPGQSPAASPLSP